MTRELSLRPLGKALGTEVVGADLSATLDDATFAWIDRAFAEHPVLVFRDQKLAAAELAAFGARFGRPSASPPEQDCAGKAGARARVQSCYPLTAQV